MPIVLPFGLPPVTFLWVTGCVCVTFLCTLEILSPFSLYFAWPLILRGQIWRFFTTFLFFSPKFSIGYLFHLFFIVNYCKELEQNSFSGRVHDFIWLFIFSMTFLSILSPIFHLPFLGSSLSFTLVYLWSRRNPFQPLNLFGLINFTAPYFPWILMAISFSFGNDILLDGIGIGVGHCYYFLEDVFPLMTQNHIRLLKTPKILKWIIYGKGKRRERNNNNNSNRIPNPAVINNQNVPPVVAEGEDENFPAINFEHEQLVNQNLQHLQ